MLENFQIQLKLPMTETHKAHITRIKRNKTTSKHILLKLLKTRGIEIILKPTRGKNIQYVYMKRNIDHSILLTGKKAIQKTVE